MYHELDWKPVLDTGFEMLPFYETARGEFLWGARRGEHARTGFARSADEAFERTMAAMEGWDGTPKRAPQPSQPATEQARAPDPTQLLLFA